MKQALGVYCLAHGKHPHDGTGTVGVGVETTPSREVRLLLTATWQVLVWEASALLFHSVLACVLPVPADPALGHRFHHRWCLRSTDPKSDSSVSLLALAQDRAAFSRTPQHPAQAATIFLMVVLVTIFSNKQCHAETLLGLKDPPSPEPWVSPSLLSGPQLSPLHVGS